MDLICDKLILKRILKAGGHSSNYFSLISFDSEACAAVPEQLIIPIIDPKSATFLWLSSIVNLLLIDFAFCPLTGQGFCVGILQLKI